MFQVNLKKVVIPINYLKTFLCNQISLPNIKILESSDKMFHYLNMFCKLHKAIFVNLIKEGSSNDLDNAVNILR